MFNTSIVHSSLRYVSNNYNLIFKLSKWIFDDFYNRVILKRLFNYIAKLVEESKVILKEMQDDVKEMRAILRDI